MSRMSLEPHAEPPPRPDVTNVRLWQIAAVRDLFIIGIFVLLIWFGYYLSAIFTPLLIAFTLAYVFNPVINYAEERWNIYRPVTISLVLALMLLFGSIFVLTFGPIVLEQVQMLTSKLPGYSQKLQERYNLDVRTFSAQLEVLLQKLREDPISVLKPVFAGTSRAFDIIGSVVGITLYIAIWSVLIPIFFFYFAWRFNPMVRRLRRFIPHSRRERILNLLGKMDAAVGNFVRGRLLVAILMGAMFAVGWLIVGVPYWFLLGAVTGVLSLVPFAAGLGLPLAIALKYLDTISGANPQGFDWMAVLLWPTVIYVAVQTIEGWVLTPWIQSKSLDMSAMMIFIVVMIGGAVGGMYGLLLAVPAAACLKILFQEAILPRVERWATEN